MQPINVTEEEICEVEKLLLPSNYRFADDAREVIRCWNSKDVAACPGSGKTTVLLAKLKILSDRMPLENNAGICVLSHTNVAVDEIRTRLSEYAETIMGYPNYVGTIQSFIDKFIVAPYLKKITNASIQVVDDDVYTQHLMSIIFRNNEYGTLQGLLRRGFKVSHYDSLFDYCRSIRFENENLYAGDQAKPIAGKTAKSTELYAQAVNELMQSEGMIRYGDSYKYSKNAIDELPERYTNLFSRRFQYVFIDEYQDCNSIQREALKRIFNAQRCCVMHIGDPDQAIYNSDINGIEDWKPEEDHLSIAFSCRYGQEIADVLKNLRSDKLDICAAAGNTGFKPTIIVYDEDSRNQVVEKYLECLNNNQLFDSNGTYKVIGAVKNKELKGLKISDYWEEYNDKINKRQEYRYWSYIDTATQYCRDGNLFKVELIFRKLICKIFHYIGVKNHGTGKDYSTVSLKKKLDNEFFDTYRNALVKLSKVEEFSRENVDGIFRELLQNLCDTSIDDIFAAIPVHFLIDGDTQAVDNGDANFLEDSQHGRRIQFDTIHGVKGETHDSTLILETERNRSSDVKSIFTYFGVGKELASSNYNRKCLYVAMSRPRKLLCLAVQDKTYEASKNIFSDWELIDCRKK